MPRSQINDISRMLSVSFHSSSGEPVEKSDLTRFWSLEMHWMKPDEANTLVETLINRGWLLEDSSSLALNPQIELASPELGWQPLLHDFSDIPDAPETIANDTYLEKEASLEVPDEVPQTEKQKNSADPDPFEGLVRHISRSSGLDRKEVLRRAKRKQRALTPLSMNLALALVAREQHLEMDEVIAMLEK